MTPAQSAALARLKTDQRFFGEHRAVYASLVMAGDARCYVIEGGEEWVRLATYEERELHLKYQMSARAGNYQEARHG